MVPLVEGIGTIRRWNAESTVTTSIRASIRERVRGRVTRGAPRAFGIPPREHLHESGD